MADETPDRLIEGYINPLAFHEVEEPRTLLPDREPVQDADVLRYLVEPHLDASSDEIIKRLLAISEEGKDRIFIAPRGVLQMLVWPLRYVKGSYALGNYLGTIALCSTVCEMSAIFIFDASNAYWAPKRKCQKIKPEFAKYFKGDAFQKMTQFERVQFLAKAKLITPDIKALFDRVRKIRNRHLHVDASAAATAAEDAIDCFLATVQIVKHALGLGIKDGKTTLRPEVYTWLDANPNRIAND
jgi:hypothetical protein